MCKLYFGVMFLVFAGHVFGQQSLTITASRPIALQPDEVVFAVTVTSGLNMGLDDVVAALAGSGITAANLEGVFSSGTQQAPLFVWTFNLPTPFSKIKDTITSLTAVQKIITQNKASLNLTVSVQGTQVSPQLQASQSCPIPALIADARAEAQMIANSAGVTVGPILALSDGGGVPAVRLPVAAYIVIVGNPFSLGLLSGLPLPSLTFASPNLLPNCTVVVKFSVLSPQ